MNPRNGHSIPRTCDDVHHFDRLASIVPGGSGITPDLTVLEIFLAEYDIYHTISHTNVEVHLSLNISIYGV